MLRLYEITTKFIAYLQMLNPRKHFLATYLKRAENQVYVTVPIIRFLVYVGLPRYIIID